MRSCSLNICRRLLNVFVSLLPLYYLCNIEKEADDSPDINECKQNNEINHIRKGFRL